MTHRGVPQRSLSRPSASLLWSLAIFILFAGLALAFYHGLFTGYAGLTLSPETLVAGERVRGTITYALGDQALPYDSQITLRVNGYERTLPLAQLLDPPVAALRAPVSFSPRLKVLVRIRELSSSSGGSKNSASGAVADSSSGSGFGSDSSGILTSGFAVSSSDTYATYYLRAGESVHDVLSSRNELSISEVRRAGSDELLETSLVSLREVGSEFYLSTTYTESVSGFTTEQGLGALPLRLDLFAFTLPHRIASPALVEVSFAYRGDVFAQLSEDIPVSRFIERAPSVDESALIPSGETSLPPDGELPSDSSTCTNTICTRFGVCAISPLGSSEASFLSSSSIRTRQCFCEEGYSYREEITCVSSEKTAVTINAGVLGGRASAPSEPPNPPPRVSVDTRSSLRWRSTYAVSTATLAFTGAVVRGLAAEERLALPLAGAPHTVGVVRIENARSVPRVLIELASSPRRFYLDQGTTYTFDVSDDGVDDLALTFVSVSHGKAILRVAPLDLASFSDVLGEGDRTATLLTSPAEVPVVHVLLNEALPSVRVFFIQSSYAFPVWCFNSIQDPQETGIDCGGGCRLCAQERRHYALIVSWIVLIALSGIFIAISRRRFS